VGIGGQQQPAVRVQVDPEALAALAFTTLVAFTRARGARGDSERGAETEARGDSERGAETEARGDSVRGAATEPREPAAPRSGGGRRRRFLFRRFRIGATMELGRSERTTMRPLLS
jgi:hypothetical protein